MADQAALQEAIQRARQLASKISQSAPVKRPAEHSGPVKVTLAYQKPVDQNKPSSIVHPKTSPVPAPNNQQHQQQPHHHHHQQQQQQHTRDAPPTSHPGEDKMEIIIPHAVIGLVIGKGGENIKRIQNETGATVRVDPNTVDEKGNKLCTITGTKQAVEEAHSQVAIVIEGAATTKRPRLQVDGSDSYRMKIPASRTGAIIGKGGETIKSIKQQSGCDIELDKGAKECGPDESVFVIRGSQDKIMKARALIEARLAQGRGGRDGPRDGPRDHSHGDHHSNRSGSKSVATGANAAPVAAYPDLPASYPAGQQNSVHTDAAWAAYFAQYANLYNQAGTQPATANATAPTTANVAMPYTGQSNLLGTTPVSASITSNQQVSQLDQQQTQASAVDSNQGAQGQQDYSDQWIEYYLANGRPDYAEQIIQMKKQQQAQKQQ